jgi:hypothetical protein
MTQMNMETMKYWENQYLDSIYDDNGFMIDPLIEMAYQSETSVENMHLPKLFPPWGKSLMVKMFMPNQYEYDQSKILNKESLWDHKMIVSDDNDDIIKTIKAINSTYKNSRQFTFEAVNTSTRRYSGISSYFLDIFN